jgi:hypothetical protein
VLVNVSFAAHALGTRLTYIKARSCRSPCVNEELETPS